MREIKFRAWDGNKLVVPCSIEFESCAYGTGQLGEEYTQLMQYTGLSDKNGVEIYEGDVIRKLRDEWPSKPESYTGSLDEYLLSITEIWEVVYHTDKYTMRRQTGSYNPWSTDNDGFTYTDINGGRHGWIEVIGDIYQNPELLK